MINQPIPSQVHMVMNEQAIATDLLLTSKNAVRNCAYAITETTTPNVRKVLNQQLQQAVAFHEQVADYMINKGYYRPFDLQQQLSLDQQMAQNAMQGNRNITGTAAPTAGAGVLPEMPFQPGPAAADATTGSLATTTIGSSYAQTTASVGNEPTPGNDSTGNATAWNDTSKAIPEQLASVNMDIDIEADDDFEEYNIYDDAF
ncbi:Coat F domain-containing protein [Evansella caseinilytica]|uniref:Coat F domain-containing protein n=1 Tax=Evansella caseinilytica TaxID=1503961 RepID=A0A1H3QDE5_9BACI|nr:spore coat protein [Evansella caseinilytica]SDZ11088.1 Coat F domain-containing protein [Evansella caseinilytica]